MTAPKPAARPGPKPRPPWLSTNSRDAGLPTDRAAWLERVLPVLDATASYRAADEALGVPRETATRWCAWLRAEQAAGRLPERTAPLPTHVSADALRGRRPTPEQAKAASALGVAARRRKREAAAKKAAPKRRAKR